jgi:hypothetical protein
MRLFRVALIAGLVFSAGSMAAQPLRVHQADARDAATGSPAARERNLRGLLDQVKQPNGGFTMHAVTGRRPTSGFALSIYKDRETTKPVKNLEVIDLVQFAKANEDLLRQPDNYFGVWHDPKSNLVYMDISIVVTSATEAERLGRQNRQGSYFDLQEGQLVDIEDEAA